MKGFQFSYSKKFSSEAFYIAIAAGSLISMAHSFWRGSNRELKRNIEHLTWIKANPPHHTTEEEMAFVEKELERQLEFQRTRWFPFSYPPTVDWAEVPMDDGFCKKFYS